MIRYILAVALLVAASCTPVFAGNPTMKADPAYGVCYAQEKVVTLPQDQDTPYLTLFGDRTDAKFREMIRWFDSDETLVGIKNQTHFNVIYSDTALYRDRYASTMPAIPCVRLQAADQVQPVAEYAGVNVPMTAEALSKGLNAKACSAECFRRRPRSPQPDVQPQPMPQPHPDPAPQPLPNPTPTPPVPRPRDMTWLLLGVLGVIGGTIGATKHFSDVYHGRNA